VRVGHRLAQLPDQVQPLGERQLPETPRHEAVQPERIRIVLEHERRSEFGLAVVENALDALVLQPFQDAGLALGGAREAVPCLRRGGAGVGVDANPALHTRRCVPRGEVLPVVALAEELFEFVVADPASASGRPHAGLFQGPRDLPRCRRIDRSPTAEAELVCAQ
jgi:hypothetical protein